MMKAQFIWYFVLGGINVVALSGSPGGQGRWHGTFANIPSCAVLSLRIYFALMLMIVLATLCATFR